MKTYQDLLAVGLNDKDRAKFLTDAIEDFQTGILYRTARDADAYYRHLNPTIMRAQKMIRTLTGGTVPDIYKPNHKIPSRFFFYFITQEVQFLLGNGVIFSKLPDKDAKLGRDFDEQVQKAATYALCGGAAFGFWNFDRLMVFPVYSADETAFCPLYDVESGALRAGIRWWSMGPGKPLRITLYEEDGITDYIQETDTGGRLGDLAVMRNANGAEMRRMPYRYTTEKSAATGEMTYGNGGYSTLPIVPLYNVNRQSELVGGRETLDAYDLMVSGLVNNTDEGNLIYWVLKNCNAMDEEDDAAFVEQLRSTHVAHANGDDGVGVEHHTVEVPVNASEVSIDKLRRQLFDDFMALDVKEISGGAATATQIRAAYEPLNQKTSKFEYQVTSFLRGILDLAGIDEDPTYRRDTIVNATEEIQNILSSAEYLDADTVTRQLCGVLGLIDDADKIISNRKEEEIGRYTEGEGNGNETGPEGTGETEE